MQKNSHIGEKNAGFLMDFCSNDIRSEAKTKGRNLQNKMAEFYQYYFMLIYMYNDFMITITLCLYICTMLS